MLKTLLALPLVALFLSAPAVTPTPWEIPSKNKAALERMATHVVVGEVQRVWTSTEKEAKHTYRRAVAEIAVDAIESGDGPKAGELVYARWFTRSWRGKGPIPTGSSGHHGWTPKRGDRVRAYLARNARDGFDPDNKDGGFNAIVPNGFEELAKK